MERAQRQMIEQTGRQYAHGIRVLLRNTLGVVVVVSREERIPHLGLQAPAGNVQRALNAGSGTLSKTVLPLEVIGEEMLRVKVRLLDEYYTSGEWQEDYEADEAGLFPADLKRGVLSQDGLYDFLTEWQDQNGK